MGIKLDCPECGQRLRFDLNTTVVECPHCGYKRTNGLDEKIAEVRAKGPRPNISLTSHDDINPRAVSLFYTAHDHLFEGKTEAALAELREAIEIQRDFFDAHLWIAKISPDEAVKRDHLSTILAYNPGHTEAMRMMLVLNGRLTQAQADSLNSTQEPSVRHAEGAVATSTTTLRCPNCKGDLSADPHTGRVVCRFCGYTAESPPKIQANGDLLFAALLERRSQPVRWVIGERLLHCNECGAERTIAADKLSTRCPFCGSNHVIEQDALQSFEQPEGLIPFTITRDEAGARIKERLRSFSERIKGWLDNNKVKAAALNGYYLPFWVFDAIVEVNRTRIDQNPYDKQRWPTAAQAIAQAYQRMTYQEVLGEVEVCAVTSPSLELTGQLGDYDMQELVSYEAGLLARYPASLYTVDFDKAALEARARISLQMRGKYGSRELGDDEDVTINVFSNVQQMSFRLLLLPVWIATLVEEDRDRRIALVNGQTGQTVLGKAIKPEKSR
ncbi:MAG: hypothetical protein JNM70_16740 [Anaerolineae bacterium]|nr:hypothetical protein [Anaerolineae bacterium]